MGHFRDATRARRPGGCASRRRRGRIWRRRRNKTAAALGRRERRRDGGRGGGLTSPRSHTMPPDRPAVRRFVAVAAKGGSGGARSGGRRAESTGRAWAWRLRIRRRLRFGRRATRGRPTSSTAWISESPWHRRRPSPKQGSSFSGGARVARRRDGCPGLSVLRRRRQRTARRGCTAGIGRGCSGRAPELFATRPGGCGGRDHGPSGRCWGGRRRGGDLRRLASAWRRQRAAAAWLLCLLRAATAQSRCWGGRRRGGDVRQLTDTARAAGSL